MAANDKTEAEIIYKVKFGEGENGKIFRAVCHSNGYPCGWEKMGHNNVFVLSASAVSESISAEMSPAIFSVFFASNHLMGRRNHNDIDVVLHYWAKKMEAADL